ncbi:MAG TPA: trypsin-like peptidase domain-containing protein [Candidatus Binatia bacterium]|nr:trypsin-like peptidase domain-containing protein [Candidatus Binatia bacterium]
MSPRLLLLATCLLAASPSRAADADRLIFLLEYVGTDYARAVADGRVVDQAEYGEALRFTKELSAAYGTGRRPDAVSAGLRDLQALIERRAPADEVWSASRKLLPALARGLGGGARPATLPNLASGRRLWASDCAVCHGPTGGGDGEVAGTLDPPPTAFRDPYLEGASPRQIYNAITFGVDGTPMPSFAAAYGEQQRWDVAFFAMTLRADFAPTRPPEEVCVGLDEIAASSNRELLARLRAKRPQASPAEVDWLRVNLIAPTGAVAPFAGPDAAAAGVLTVALQLQDVFASVAERVSPFVLGVSSWVPDPEWTPERLQRSRGDGWAAANQELLRYPGFRPQRAGSGLLVDDDGWVLSCDHLLRDDQGALNPLVDVELPDHSHATARVVGAEPTLDLAVLHIGETTTLPPLPSGLEIGDSDRVRAGHWAIALGDPPGPERVLRVGTVSSTALRQCYQEQLSATGLQTSLEVPAGGLGGPVVDILGHVIGLSVRPVRGADDPLGMPAATSFTLPSNLVMNLLEALKASRSQRSPWLGISVLEPAALRTRPETRTITIPPTGVYVDDVFAPSPASRAGVRAGDFLVALGGHELRSVGDFQTQLYGLGIGTEATLRLLRDGATIEVVAPIEERPAAARPR